MAATPKFQPLKYTAQAVQDKIDKIHNGNITLDATTYTGVKNKAKFIDKIYGEWWTQPYLVMKGFHHPKNRIRALNESVAWSYEEISTKVAEIHNSRYFMIKETFINTQKKAWFYDVIKKEWFETRPTYVLHHKGYDNPGDRIDKIRKKNTPLLQKLGKARIKYIDTCGNSVTNLCKQFGVPSATYLKLAKEVSADFAIKSLSSHIVNGQYIKYKSNLEIFFVDLFKKEFPAVEKWNKRPLEGGVSGRPDFRFDHDSKIIYVDSHGLFFHSEYHVDNKYHQERAADFRNAKIKFFQFFADEIFSKSDIVKSMVLSRLGIAKNKFFARNLNLTPVSIKESQEFFDNNHLMGYKSAKAVGLYKDSDLVCALSYKEYKDYIEIARFCTKLNTSCAGGFGRLVAYLKQFNKPIISFCDLRYSDGHSYEATGFKQVGETLSWYWTDGQNRFNRLLCRAGDGKTERENADEKGWFKIFDAGQRKYQLK